MSATVREMRGSRPVYSLFRPGTPMPAIRTARRLRTTNPTLEAKPKGWPIVDGLHNRVALGIEDCGAVAQYGEVVQLFIAIRGKIIQHAVQRKPHTPSTTSSPSFWVRKCEVQRKRR